MSQTRKATLAVSADLKYSQAVRTFAERFFLAEGVPAKWAKRLMLISDELFMNAVYYGSDETSEVILKIWADDEKVTFSIQDEGKGKKKIKAVELKKIVEQKGKDMNHTKTSGRGLSIITTNWTDECSVDDLPSGGIVIMATKYRKTFEVKNSPTDVQDLKREKAENNPIRTKVVKFSGSIDEHNYAESIAPVSKLLADQKPLNLILNFDDLDYFNSLFIGAIANWQAEVHKRGGHILIIGARDSAKDILELCGLDQIIPFYRDEKEALTYLQKS